uniref:Uncharacterized protein n=1 Tax=Picea sitchensis TaxID=3332 RepID=D5ADK5_PICSI|nr:unknown [Picea sitchensis]
MNVLFFFRVFFTKMTSFLFNLDMAASQLKYFQPWMTDDDEPFIHALDQEREAGGLDHCVW